MEVNDRETDKWIWWKHGVIYHIYPLSFYDSNNDGKGDIKGIIEKLDYLNDLGIDAIWLSPIYVSPMFDFGYDVSDYRTIHPDFGTFDDFDNLIVEAHKRNMRIIMDLIMNHTSIEHPWFIESKSSLDNPKRDWYIWRSGKGIFKPNNWQSALGGSAWTYDKKTKQYYFHSFFKQQPDLNWRNTEMADIFFNDIRFWLEKGVDGFRLDVINMIIKDKKFRSNPILWVLPFLQRHIYTRNRPKSYKIVKKLRRLLDEYENKMCVGEIYATPPGNSTVAASYLAEGKNSLHLTFDFSLLFRPWSAKGYFRYIKKWNTMIPSKGWPSYVLSNHDLNRNYNRNIFIFRRYKLEKAKISAVLLLTLKGTPFIYYGEEIGMPNIHIKRSRIKDPLGKRYWPIYSGRDNARTPMQWNDSKYAGFSNSEPWLPVGNNYKFTNVETELNSDNSLLTLYKKILFLRKKYPVFQFGEWVPLSQGEKGIIAYKRVYNEEEILVVLNFKHKNTFFIIPNNNIWSLIYSTSKNTMKEIIEGKIIVERLEAAIYIKENC